MARKTAQEEENILNSVRSLIEKGEFGEARKIAELHSWRFWGLKSRYALIDLFLKNEPPEKCEKCGANAHFNTFDDLRWAKGACSNCEYIHAEKVVVENYKKTMAQRGVPMRFMDSDLKDFPKKYGEFISKPKDKGVYVSGQVGTGKTRLLAALMKNEILRTTPKEYGEYQGGPAGFDPPRLPDYPLFITVPELLLKIRDTFNSSETDEAEVIGRYSKVDKLFLDDLGTEKPTEWARQTLFLLINRRYEGMKKTFISSNLTLDQIAERLDDRIASRIAEMCIVLEMKGKDRRVNK